MDSHEKLVARLFVAGDRLEAEEDQDVPKVELAVALEGAHDRGEWGPSS